VATNLWAGVLSDAPALRQHHRCRAATTEP
jgi:hypothetical protein